MVMKLKETCPDCGAGLVLKRNCNCDERMKGWLILKQCPNPECGRTVRWNPRELFGEKNAV
jgi:endogenous inhibitor of DNA gyrase (YacG/DUF329 family)